LIFRVGGGFFSWGGAGIKNKGGAGQVFQEWNSENILIKVHCNLQIGYFSDIANIRHFKKRLRMKKSMSAYHATEVYP